MNLFYKLDLTLANLVHACLVFFIFSIWCFIEHIVIIVFLWLKLYCFLLQKLDLGICSKVHDPALKADYELASKNKAYDYEFEVNKNLYPLIFFKLFSKFYFEEKIILSFLFIATGKYLTICGRL